MDDQNINPVVLQWEGIFANGNQVTRFPFSDLVSLVNRFRGELPSSVSVLELGLGTGANIPLFDSLGFQYTGIEGSKTACEVARARFPHHKLIEFDFSKPLPFPSNSFELVVDRSAITLNAERIQNIFNEISRLLVSGGLFISVDFFSKQHHYAIENDLSRNLSCFLDEKLFSALSLGFDVLLLRHKSEEQLFPIKRIKAFYDFVLRKK